VSLWPCWTGRYDGEKNCHSLPLAHLQSQQMFIFWLRCEKHPPARRRATTTVLATTMRRLPKRSEEGVYFWPTTAILWRHVGLDPARCPALGQSGREVATLALHLVVPGGSRWEVVHTIGFPMVLSRGS